MYTQPQSLRISWFYWIAPSSTALGISHISFQGHVRSQVSAFFSMYFNYFTSQQVPSFAPDLCCGAVMFHSAPNCRKDSVQCTQRSTLTNICFKSCTTAHLQLPPCLYLWFLLGKTPTKPGHMEELSVDWSPPIMQLQHVQST